MEFVKSNYRKNGATASGVLTDMGLFSFDSSKDIITMRSGFIEEEETALVETQYYPESLVSGLRLEIAALIVEKTLYDEENRDLEAELVGERDRADKAENQVNILIKSHNILSVLIEDLEMDREWRGRG